MSHMLRSCASRWPSPSSGYVRCVLSRPITSLIQKPTASKQHDARQFIPRNGPTARGYSTSAEALSVPSTSLSSPSAELSRETSDHVKVRLLVEDYRARGHHLAKINPLSRYKETPVESLAASYGFTSADLDRSFTLSDDLLPSFRADDSHTMTLREVIDACEKTYCSTYGVEIQHIEDPAQLQWLRSRIEKPNPISLSRDEKLRLLDGIYWAGGFEQLLATKFPTAKRYGLDGVESLLPAVSMLIDRSVDKHGVEDVVVGSCHRGRLTLAASVYGKGPEAVLAEFLGRPGWGLLPSSSGDVKTHLGFEGTHVTPEGRSANLSVLANPSHLESIDPVAQGFARAVQEMRGDDGLTKSLCLELHGDAAFTGQGVVYETLSMAKLESYDVGGTIRVVVNNQIGFTASPSKSRSSKYASDIAKFLNAPIFHVNSDDPEAVAFVCQLAADWRATFSTDCVVDLICYRRYGHNELDQPRFTQPLLYKTVDAHPQSEDIYRQRLIDEGVATASELESRKTAIRQQLEQHYEAAKTYEAEVQRPFRAWDKLPGLEQLERESLPAPNTAVTQEVADKIADQMACPPQGFKIHRNVKRTIDTRKSLYDKGILDWTAGEALAMGSLALEGHPVRVLGEDAQRGTFSQRHAVLHDQETGKNWTPLAELSSSQAPFIIDNSPLSEYGALGFEYGYSLANPDALVVWEAQFGDFVNTAQVMIDNFLVSCETKWGDRTGLVLSLPHGHDGQGPEHSSARIERFLQMVSEDGRVWPENLARQHQDCNIQVVYPTTPANYFHALRRQLRRDYRKPLVVLFSKSLLRHPLNRSPISDFTGSSSFQPVIVDAEQGKSFSSPQDIRRVILCTGQVHAALHKHRQEQGIVDTAITRIEELNPFPFAQVKAALEMYPHAESIVWAQEEHYNHGAWTHVRDRVDTMFRNSEMLRGKELKYAGRGQNASTATGSRERHLLEEAQLVKDAFTV